MDNARFDVPGVTDPRPTMPMGVALPVAGMGTGLEYFPPVAGVVVGPAPVAPAPVAESDQLAIALDMIVMGTGPLRGVARAHLAELEYALLHLVDNHPKAATVAVWNLSLGHRSQERTLQGLAMYARSI